MRGNHMQSPESPIALMIIEIAHNDHIDPIYAMHAFTDESPISPILHQFLESLNPSDSLIDELIELIAYSLLMRTIRSYNAYYAFATDCDIDDQMLIDPIIDHFAQICANLYDLLTTDELIESLKIPASLI